MDFLLNKIQDDVNYLKSQGKQIKEIRMNSKVLENMMKLTDVEVSKGVATVLGINIEADDSFDNYVFILDEVT